MRLFVYCESQSSRLSAWYPSRMQFARERMGSLVRPVACYRKWPSRGCGNRLWCRWRCSSRRLGSRFLLGGLLRFLFRRLLRLLLGGLLSLFLRGLFLGRALSGLFRGPLRSLLRYLPRRLFRRLLRSLFSGL